MVISAGAELLNTILESDTNAESTVSHYFQRHPQYGSHDRRLIADAVYGCLRRLRSLGYALGHPERPNWQITPDEARSRVELWVALQKSDARQNLADFPAAVASDLPDWIYTALCIGREVDETQALAQALAQPAPVDLRVNTLRAARPAVLRQLHHDGIDATPTPFSPDGIRLTNRLSLIEHPLYQTGVIEIQDEGSQLISRILAPRRQEIVVDFCAGAGGKTLHLGALMANTGMIYALDRAPRRLEQLRDRARRAGLNNVHLMRIDSLNGALVLRNKADRVLVDAPCTGSGTFRRRPDRKWRTHNLDYLTAEQTRILATASELVRPGGKLVYATCSLFHAENNAIIDQFRVTHPEFNLLSLESFYSRVKLPNQDQFFLRLDPHQHGTDGFYAVLFLRG